MLVTETISIASVRPPKSAMSPAPPPPEDEAALGSRVGFRMGGEMRTIDIVGDDEADPASGRNAFSAPLARALIGGGAGDMADFGGRTDAIEIVSVTGIPAG